MSSLDPLYQGVLYNTVNASQQEITTLLKQLQTGLKINSASDDPANIYVSDALNLEALENASTASNAQNGLTYLQVAQKAYGDIVTQLNKIKTLANNVLTGSYDSVQITDFQNQITESINAIKLIETGTTFNGIQVFNNSNSVGMVNEHMFAVTSKTDVTITTATLVDNRGKDYSAYLTNTVIHRYEKEDVGGTITLRNDLGATITPDATHITIESAAELVAALSTTATAGKTYILLDNIDLSVLGTQTQALIQQTFQGTLDGNGYAITGLQVNSTASNVGLFAQLGNTATVQNLILDDFAVKGNGKVGSLAGFINGTATVTNVVALNVTISGASEVGGLVGANNNGDIVNSYATGKVSGDALSTYVGGLVGNMASASATISNSFANVDVIGGTYVGGLAGANGAGATISESYARGIVEGQINVGGLVGTNSATITNTYSLGAVSGNSNAAGLVGNNTGTISNSYSLSEVTDTTTTYDIAQFQVVSSGENISGLAERPNDAFSITFDYAGKTYAFDTIDNFNKFKSYTLGSPTGEVELLYEKDVATNTWYGRKLDATEMYSYAASALPDAPVNGVPEDNNGVSYSVLTTIGAGGFAAAGTYAFKTEAEKNSFLTFNSTNTTTSNVDKFYKLDAPNNKWDSQALTVNASTYSVQVGAGASFSNTPLSSYGLFNDTWTDTTGAYSGGAANTVYAFSTEADKNAFVNGNAEIGLFYKANADNTWSALEQKLGAAGTYSYTSTDIVGSTTGDDPQDDLNHYVYLTGDGLNAFSSQEDLDNFNSGTPIGEITKYYAKTAPDTWTARKITKTVTTVYVPSASGSPVDSAPIDSDGVLYSFVKNIGGAFAGTYAFATQTDFDNFANGTPIGIIGAYYKKVGTLNNAWEKYQVTKTDGSITYASNPVAAPNIDSAPLDSDGVNYNIVKTLNAGADIYRFASQQDADNFNNGITFLGAVSKFYKYDSGNDKWQALTVKTDPNVAIAPVATGATAQSAPVDPEGLIYSYRKTAYNSNLGKTLTYAFASVTDMNNFVDVDHFRSLIGRFYEDRADGSTNPWWGYSTTFDAAATITDLGLPVVSKPVSTDGLNYNIFRTDGSGNTLAFSSQVDADNWNNGTYKDSINRYYIHLTTDPATQWIGYSVTQTASYVTYSYSVGGTGAVKHAMPNDADGISYAIEKNIAGGPAAGDYRFATQADADSFNDGINFTGTIAKFYKYTDRVTDTWEVMSLVPVAKVTDLAISVGSGPIDVDGVAYTYKKNVKDNGGTGTLLTYAFATVTDMNNFVNDQVFLAPIGRYYVDMQDGTDNPWLGKTVKPKATETAVVEGVVSGTVSMPQATSFNDLHRNATNDGWLAFASYDDYWNQFLSPKADKSVMYMQKMDTDTDWTVWHTTLQQGETTLVTGNLASMPSEYNLLGHTGGGGTIFYYCSNAQDQADFIAWGNGTLDHSVNFNTVVDYGTGTYAHENVYAYYTGKTQMAGSYASKPLDQEYNVALDYGSSDPKGTNGEYGLGQYYFETEADRDTFIGINNYFYNAKPANLRPVDDAIITYYKRNDSTTDWTKITLTYKAEALSVASSGGWAYNKPDDGSYNIAYGPDAQGTGYLNTALANGSGFYYFQTDSDKTAFTNYINGSTDAINVNYYVMVSADPSNAANVRTWSKQNLSYGEKSGSIQQIDKGVSVVSQPLDPTYSYYNVVNGGWFASVAEADIFNQWQAGGARTGLDGTGKTFNDIYWYQHKGVDMGTPQSWFEYKLWDDIHPATYAVTGTGMVGSKPSDNSYAVAGMDPNNFNNILYFNSTGDKDTYIQYLTDKMNGIDPTSTFDISFYEYNSVGNTWDLKKAVESVSRTNLSWIYTRPDDVNYNFTNTATNGWYGTAGKANGDGLYYFQSDSDRVDFENYLAGGTDTFNITYLFMASETAAWFTMPIDNTVNPRTWTKYNLERLNPLSQSAIAIPEVDSKPKSPSYDILSTYGGGQYYFSSEGEKQTFEAFKAGSLTGSGLTFSDIYYYEKTGAGATANWKENKLTSTVIPDAYNKVAVDTLPADGFVDTVNSRPNDPNFGQNLMYTYAGSAAGAAYDGTFFFSSVDDEAIFNKVRQNLQTGDIPNVYYYKYNGGSNKWDRNKLISTTSTTYNAPVDLGPVHTGSPSALGYEKVWKQDASNEFAFNSALDMANFQLYKAGTLTGNVDMMYYYRVNDTSWQQARITSSLGAASYAVMARPADNALGRPEKDGYDILSGDGLKAFANAVDLALYNNGAPTGAIDLFYEFNGATKQWDAKKSQQNTSTYTNAATGTQVDGIPEEEGYGTNAKIGATYYAFKDATDLANFNLALAQGWGVSNATRIAGIDKYYQYDTATNKWQANKVAETNTQSYSIIANATPDIAGKAETPKAAGYDYLTTIAAGIHAGTYAFKSIDERTSFLNYDAGNGTVNPILNYYKLNTAAKIADPVSGKLIDSWDGQRLEYDNEVGFFVGDNTGTITNSFYGLGSASANYVGDDGVTMLGNTQIAAKVAPMTTWDNTTVWDFSTSKPTLRKPKVEGSEDIKEENLAELNDETKYVFRTYEAYATNDIRLNTALSAAGSFTAVTPGTMPVGFDAGGRPLVSTIALGTLANKYISDINVADNANPSNRYTEGKDFVLYTNDNGATWNMDLLSSEMYGKTLKIDYAGASTAAVDQVNSGFNIYLGDNKNLNLKDMTLDLAGRLNFNLTRQDGARGTLDALSETLEYMKIKQAQVNGDIMVATTALSNKTNQSKTMTSAVSTIKSVDEAKAKAELAKRQLLQQKTDTIIQKFYDLQTSTMQALLSASFTNAGSGLGGVYQGLTGVNSLYNKNIIDYNYNILYETE